MPGKPSGSLLFIRFPHNYDRKPNAVPRNLLFSASSRISIPCKRENVNTKTRITVFGQGITFILAEAGIRKKISENEMKSYAFINQKHPLYIQRCPKEKD